MWMCEHGWMEGQGVWLGYIVECLCSWTERVEKCVVVEMLFF